MNLLIIIAANAAAHSSSATKSHAPKPILQIFVRFTGAPSPRVSAAAEAYSAHSHSVGDAAVFLTDCGEEPEHHRHGNRYLLRNVHALHRRHELAHSGRADHVGSHRDTRHEPRRNTQRHQQQIHRAGGYRHKQDLRDVSRRINSGVGERCPEFPFRQQENKRNCGQRPAQVHNEDPTTAHHYRDDHDDQQYLGAWIEYRALPRADCRKHTCHHAIPARTKCFFISALPMSAPTTPETKLAANSGSSDQSGIYPIIVSTYSWLNPLPRSISP